MIGFKPSFFLFLRVAEFPFAPAAAAGAMPSFSCCNPFILGDLCAPTVKGKTRLVECTRPETRPSSTVSERVVLSGYRCEKAADDGASEREAESMR